MPNRITIYADRPVSWKAQVSQGAKGDPGTGGGSGGLKSVNHDPGDTDGNVTMGLTQLQGVTIAPVQYDDDGVLIPGTGPKPGEFVGYDVTTGEFINQPVTGFAPEGWVPPYTLRGVSVAAGDTIPADLPDDALIFDETKPSAPLIESINTVTASGASLTLPAPTASQIHDITLTANCTLTFPTPVAGTRFRLLLRQDSTGNRVVTWPSGLKWNGGTAPTLSTAGGAENVLDFTSIGGSTWRQIGSVMSYTGGPTAGPTPTVKGTYAANAGASNTLTSVSTALPTGIANGDIGYMVVTTNGTTATMTTNPTTAGTANWTMVDGPVVAGGLITWLFRRVLSSTDSGATVTSGVMSVNGRPCMTGIVVSGGTTTGEVWVSAQDTVADTSLDVPAITPGVANSLLVNIAATRTGIQSGTPQTQVISVPGTGAVWTKQREHYEGRWDTTNVNFGGFIETRGLTGNANVAQTGQTATYLVSASERAYLIAVPPPVS